MNYHLTKKSGNSKVGPIPVSTTSADTCPPTCPLLANCYASGGPLALHWRKVTAGERGHALGEFLEQLRGIEPGTPFRHNQAGDLPGADGELAAEDCRQFGAAAAHLGGWSYTHYRPTARNLPILRELSESITINLSADTMADVDRLATAGLPMVVTVPSNHPEQSTTPKGRRVYVCPNQTREITCAECMLCENRHPGRPTIAFRAHGAGAKLINEGGATDND